MDDSNDTSDRKRTPSAPRPHLRSSEARERAGLTNPVRPARRAFGLCVAFIERVRASVYGVLVLRTFAVVVVIAVLACLGRTPELIPNALAGHPTAGANDNGTSADASAGPLPALPSPQETPARLPSAEQPPATEPRTTRAALGGCGDKHASPEAPVYVNVAEQAELARLPGVGPKRAEAILALRHKVGRFRRVEDLLRVKGIGRAAIKKWRPLVRFDEPGAMTPDAGPPR